VSMFENMVICVEIFTFIGYFCEICSMCENKDVFEVCVVS
jgi:hypothetical protein